MFSHYTFLEWLDMERKCYHHGQLVRPKNTWWFHLLSLLLGYVAVYYVVKELVVTTAKALFARIAEYLTHMQ